MPDSSEPTAMLTFIIQFEHAAGAQEDLGTEAAEPRESLPVRERHAQHWRSQHAKRNETACDALWHHAQLWHGTADCVLPQSVGLEHTPPRLAVEAFRPFDHERLYTRQPCAGQ